GCEHTRLSAPAEASVSGRDDARLLDHQHRAADRHNRAGQQAGRDREGLSRARLDGVGALELDPEDPVEREEEFVSLVGLVQEELAHAFTGRERAAGSATGETWDSRRPTAIAPSSRAARHG